MKPAPAKRELLNANGGLINKSAFVVGDETAPGQGVGVSRGTADAINVIAQGTIRGVFDRLMDFSQYMRAGGADPGNRTRAVSEQTESTGGPRIA